MSFSIHTEFCKRTVQGWLEQCEAAVALSKGAKQLCDDVQLTAVEFPVRLSEVDEELSLASSILATAIHQAETSDTFDGTWQHMPPGSYLALLHLAWSANDGRGADGNDVLLGDAQRWYDEAIHQMEVGGAGGFLDWLAGPDAPGPFDLTAMFPGLQNDIGNAIDIGMRLPAFPFAPGPLKFIPNSAWVGALFGFEYVPGQDFYTTNESSLQSHFGFHDVYDQVGKLLGMDLEDEVVTFEANGVEYRLELWKGSYASGGAFGGEIGLYTRRPDETGLRWLLQQIPGYYSTAAGDDQVTMTQTIYNVDADEDYFTNHHEGADDEDHFWNLAIRTIPASAMRISASAARSRPATLPSPRRCTRRCSPKGFPPN